MEQTHDYTGTFKVGLRAQLEELYRKEQEVLEEIQRITDESTDYTLRAALLQYLLTSELSVEGLAEVLEKAGMRFEGNDFARWTAIRPCESTPLDPASGPVEQAERFAFELLMHYSRACKWAALLGAFDIVNLLQKRLDSRQRGLQELQSGSAEKQAVQGVEPLGAPHAA